jgi:ribonuclease BN (tRNA processing enzyme)
VHITVLGKSPSWPDAGGACSGYLVEDGQTSMVVDCGSGVFAQLRTVRDYIDVDAIVISHMHADHFADLIPYACALTYGPRERPPRPQLMLPPDGVRSLQLMAAAGGHGDTLVPQAFDVSEYDPASRARVRTLRLRFQPVPHFVPANAIEVTSTAADGRFTYGADHRATEALDGFAAGTDLLMLEATLSEREPEASRGHMTAAEAGALAARCEARRLVLVHISDELDAGHAVAAAQRAYRGPVEVARRAAVYDV